MSAFTGFIVLLGLFVLSLIGALVALEEGLRLRTGTTGQEDSR